MAAVGALILLSARCGFLSHLWFAISPMAFHFSGLMVKRNQRHLSRLFRLLTSPLRWVVIPTCPDNFSGEDNELGEIAT